MAITKRLNLNNIFLFLFLALFPFGQIIRIGMLQPIDLIAGIAAIYAVVKRFERPEIFKYLKTVLIMAGFSWLFGALVFLKIEVFYGLLYLVRLGAYFYFLIYVWNFVKKSVANRELITSSLVLVSVFSAIFGWIQYFSLPSIRPFFVWGWDEHLFRLVGTFLDPTFLGIIIVFGLLTMIYRYIISGRGRDLAVGIFLLVSLAFTYSRASYLAFFAGLAVIGIYKKKISQIIYLVVGLVLLIVLLPTSGNTILRFTREFSAIARIENYSEALNIFKTSPVFGVGYNNFCLAKAEAGGIFNPSSHACSGSDSSILFILATTGVAGLITLINTLRGIGSGLKGNPSSQILIVSFTALLVHSVFSNSLVFPWVLGYMIILLAASLRREV